MTYKFLVVELVEVTPKQQTHLCNSSSSDALVLAHQRKGNEEMAIYHLHVDSYRRSRGRTAIGGVAYRRGLKAACRKSGRHFNFRSKGEVAFSELIPAKNDNTDYRQLENLLKLFEAIEHGERHPRATLGREVEAALPIELSLSQQVELVRGFIRDVRELFDADKAFFDFSIHAKLGNPHVHICMAERELIAPFEFAKSKRRDWDGDEFVKQCRDIWEANTNIALKQAGISQRVDSRSHVERGLEILPSLHEGKAAYFNSEVKKMNEIIRTTNQQLLKAPELPPDEDFSNAYRVGDEECCGCENAEADQTKSPFQNKLAKSIYDGFNLYGLSYIQLKNPNYVTLYFSEPVRSRIVDHGSLITAHAGTPKDNAERIIELARLKKWQVVRLTGSIAFVEAAMMNALEAGIDVSPIDEEQRKLWLSIKATMAAETVEQVVANDATVMPLSLSGIGAKLRNRETPTAIAKSLQKRRVFRT